MKAAVSLWSADLMEVGAALDRLTGVADAFHVDVMDGHFAPDLLFGPDFVRAVRKRTRGVVDVHLIVSEADRWVNPFAEAGADVLTVYPQPCPDLRGTLVEIERLGASPGVSVDLGYPLGRGGSLVIGRSAVRVRSSGHWLIRGLRGRPGRDCSIRRRNLLPLSSLGCSS
jgi:ribulose-phosphate 3-epimerase